MGRPCGILPFDRPKYIRQYTKDYYHARPEWALYTHAKKRAKKSGQEFTIQVSDVVIPKHCPILGIELITAKDSGGRMKSNSATLDRIENSKGYIPGNIRVISMYANARKGNLTIEQAERLLAYMKGNL